MVQEAWEGLMVQFSRRYAERQANMFVVCATTPAQVFHALRRQMNRYAQALAGEMRGDLLPDAPEVLVRSADHGPGCVLE